jgi:hypothetical protein
MARKPAGTDATGRLDPAAATQTAPKGIEIGALDRDEVLADFRKVAAGD